MTDGQHLSDQNSEIDALETKEESSLTLSRVYAALGIIVILVSAIIALANISSTATQGLQLSQQNAAAIEKKADRDEVRDRLKSIDDKLEKLNDYLLNGRDKR